MSPAGYDRVVERRRAVALARHYREVEGLSIAQVARQLGRSPAPVKAYFYDSSHANKRPTDSPQEPRFWAYPETLKLVTKVGWRRDGAGRVLPAQRPEELRAGLRRTSAHYGWSVSRIRPLTTSGR